MLSVLKPYCDQLKKIKMLLLNDGRFVCREKTSIVDGLQEQQASVDDGAVGEFANFSIVSSSPSSFLAPVTNDCSGDVGVLVGDPFAPPAFVFSDDSF